MDRFGGPVQTPKMTRIANMGLKYSNFHTTEPCSPTRASLLTGRNATSNGMATIAEFSSGFPDISTRIPFENGFISEVLGEHGYNTYCVVLQAARGHSNARFARAPGLDLDTVRRWRAGSPRWACPTSTTVNAAAAHRRSQHRQPGQGAGLPAARRERRLGTHPSRPTTGDIPAAAARERNGAYWAESDGPP
ncbi:hypothetical protein KCMC57_up58130 [Kitasatospora sp. CMC57]|uniref:Sulfatase N-terminal domain-containing protein n=2 Tax=Kitasatospora sp. CMC57 TaxID=3231513 RepID=A0AB33KAE0_9ACTN